MFTQTLDTIKGGCPKCHKGDLDLVAFPYEYALICRNENCDHTIVRQHLRDINKIFNSIKGEKVHGE
jgi:hypothetical protein